MLRTHTSAHQIESFRKKNRFLISGDVYRRDEIDSSHYPIFHQMEGAQIFNMQNIEQEISEDKEYLTSLNSSQKNPLKDHSEVNDDTIISENNPIQSCHPIEQVNFIIQHLKFSLNSLIKELFISHDKNLKIRWIDAYFPFTSPSWEMEVFFKDKWLEICGCGIVEQDVLNNAGNVLYFYFFVSFIEKKNFLKSIIFHSKNPLKCNKQQQDKMIKSVGRLD
jgi:phenylalanyl-tRNA synthetase alpha chain